MPRVLEERPWEALDPALAALLAPELPALAEETIAALREGVPAYARPLEGVFGRQLRAGVQEALRQFIEMIGNPGRGRPGGRELYMALGRGEMRAGRSLDALLAAYRIGARVAWRRLSSVSAELDPGTLGVLAESIFAYIDELSAESVEGYALEQAAVAGEAQRRRHALVALLVQSPPGDPAAIEEAAARAGWALPDTLAAIALGEGHADRAASRLGTSAVAAEVAGVACVLVADPEAPGRPREVAAALGATPAALGPAVGWRDAGRSFARATAALRLADEGSVASDGLIDSAEHLPALLMRGDRGLLSDLADRRLAPLDALAPRTRERLAETLRGWLSHQGRLPQVAHELGVHPQTVRYRLGQLHDLLGPALADPEARFELELALRARALDQRAEAASAATRSAISGA